MIFSIFYCLYFCAFAQAAYVFSSANGAVANLTYRSVALTTNGERQFVGLELGYLMRSSDYGSTWTNVIGLGVNNWIQVATSSDGLHVAAIPYSGKGIYISSDYGTNWALSVVIASEILENIWYGLASSSTGQQLVTTVKTSNDTGSNTIETYDIYRSIDYGDTWIKCNITTRGGEWGTTGLASSANGKQLVAAAISEFLYLSTDYGVTWSALSSSVPNTSPPTLVRILIIIYLFFKNKYSRKCIKFELFI